MTYERRRERRCRVQISGAGGVGDIVSGGGGAGAGGGAARALAGRCTLVMDATGVGAAVLDLLRGADLGCGIEPVILTGGRAGALPRRDVGRCRSGT